MDLELCLHVNEWICKRGGTDQLSRREREEKGRQRGRRGEGREGRGEGRKGERRERTMMMVMRVAKAVARPWKT